MHLFHLSPVLYQRSGRYPVIPQFRPDPLLNPPPSPKQVFLRPNLHHTGCISSFPFPYCYVASPWSRKSRVLLFCQFLSALRSFSPPRFMVGFRRRLIIAQLDPGPVADHSQPSPQFRRSCHVFLSHSLHRRDPYQVVFLMHVSQDARIF